jgi:hypothetical protein
VNRALLDVNSIVVFVCIKGRLAVNRSKNRVVTICSGAAGVLRPRTNVALAATVRSAIVIVVDAAGKLSSTHSKPAARGQRLAGFIPAETRTPQRQLV